MEIYWILNRIYSFIKILNFLCFFSGFFMLFFKIAFWRKSCSVFNQHFVQQFRLFAASALTIFWCLIEIYDVISPTSRRFKSSLSLVSHAGYLISQWNSSFLFVSSQKPAGCSSLPSAVCTLCFLSFRLSFAAQLFPPSVSIRLWLMPDGEAQTEAMQTQPLCWLLSIPLHLGHNEVLVSLGERQQCLARQQVRRAARLL